MYVIYLETLPTIRIDFIHFVLLYCSYLIVKIKGEILEEIKREIKGKNKKHLLQFFRVGYLQPLKRKKGETKRAICICTYSVF